MNGFLAFLIPAAMRVSLLLQPAAIQLIAFVFMRVSPVWD